MEVLVEFSWFSDGDFYSQNGVTHVLAKLHQRNTEWSILIKEVQDVMLASRNVS